ncbi:hypothetical protein BJ508DRAFT_304106 [Ascobolus immersus RN42]|uniref:Uncharacterized protein n=1 Tax=Ascobolus immersus RN42 TaxID=1160509 RepID=A0A3N4IID3_ASCIM|nr:hypothetical protein BJ508DRAFT_304106 [Ascobolus immersus RN42]
MAPLATYFAVHPREESDYDECTPIFKTVFVTNYLLCITVLILLGCYYIPYFAGLGEKERRDGLSWGYRFTDSIRYWVSGQWLCSLKPSSLRQWYLRRFRHRFTDSIRYWVSGAARWLCSLKPSSLRQWYLRRFRPMNTKLVLRLQNVLGELEQVLEIMEIVRSLRRTYTSGSDLRDDELLFMTTLLVQRNILRELGHALETAESDLEDDELLAEIEAAVWRVLSELGHGPETAGNDHDSEYNELVAKFKELVWNVLRDTETDSTVRWLFNVGRDLGQACYRVGIRVNPNSLIELES